MSIYIVRIELYETAEEDYEILNKAMLKIGFSRTILDTNKLQFHLPHSEYGIFSELEPEKIIAIIKNAAEQTNKKYGILLTKAQDVKFHQLKPVGTSVPNRHRSDN